MKNINDRSLSIRYRANKKAKFQKAQTEMFLALLPKNCRKVLDVGCGKGYFSFAGAKDRRFKEIWGSDVFKDYRTREISQPGVSAYYRPIKNGRLDYKDNCFDLVFSMDAIEHADDDVEFVKEHIRVCKTGGTVLIGTPNLWRPVNVIKKITGRLKFPQKIGDQDYGESIHVREYLPKMMQQVIQQAAGGKTTISAIEVFPCWFGIMCLDLGLDKLFWPVERLCHFYFYRFEKA